MTNKITAIGAAVALAVAALWYVMFWSPTNHRLASARSATAAAQATSDRLGAALSGLVVLSHQLPSEERKLAASEPALPTAVAVDQLIEQIHAAAASAHVSWSNESQAVAPAASSGTLAATGTSSSTGPAGTSTLTMSLSVAGTYQSLARFIVALEHLPRLLVLDTIGYSAGTKGSKLSVTINGRAFFDPAPLPKFAPLRNAS